MGTSVLENHLFFQDLGTEEKEIHISNEGEYIWYVMYI